MNNALFVIHSIIHSIVQQNYSFKEFIHSKKIQNYSFKKFIHSRKSKIIHSKKIFIQVKNGLSPRASDGRGTPDAPAKKIYDSVWFQNLNFMSGYRWAGSDFVGRFGLFQAANAV